MGRPHQVITLRATAGTPQRERERRIRIEQEASWLIEGVFPPPPPTNSEMVFRWQRVAKAAEELELALHDVLDEDEAYGYVQCRALLLQAHASVRCHGRERSRRRKANDYGLASIVDSLLGLWTSSGGQLRFSQGASEHPRGPLIQFLTMAFEPMATAGLKLPSPSQLARFIRKKRDDDRSNSADRTNDFE
jgi:hypothetical protein